MRSLIVTLSLGGVLALSACQTTTPQAPKADADADADSAAKVQEAPAEPDKQLVALFKPLPKDMADADHPVEQARVELGRMLYYETRMSKNHDISCNSCHMLDKYGVDNEPTSPGHKGQRGERNSPTVYNAALHATQFWDGRAANVEEQAKGPILNPIEMGMESDADVVAVIKSIPGYKEKFEAAFPGQDDPITYDNIATAIGAFERTLVTPGKWDAYLKGDASALTDQEVEGARLFVETGCTTCHMGVTVGGSMFQKLGLVKPYETEDEGRKAVTGKDADLHMFKVPALRNVAKTGPYFHDGSIKTLDEAVKIMAEYQLGKELSDEDTTRIVTFLQALTGELPTEQIAKPELPESGPDTPAPDPS